MEIEFLSDVQRSGWWIGAATTSECVGVCQTPGCGVRVRLRPGRAVPRREPQALPGDVELTGWDGARVCLRKKREVLGLPLDAVRNSSPRPLRTFEREDWRCQPNIATLIDWAQALGFDVVLRPAVLARPEGVAVRVLPFTEKQKARAQIMRDARPADPPSAEPARNPSPGRGRP